jgi:transposase
MGKQQRAKAARKKIREFQISIEELEALLDRLENKCLLDADYPLIIEIIKNITVIQDQFKNSTTTIKKLQKLMFGPKTERTKLPADLKATDTGEPAKGHGKKPVDQWVDTPVQICQHSHEEFKEGQLCPKCALGKLYRFKPSVRVRVVASRALDVERHEVDRLRCSGCGWLFTAPVSEDLTKYPDATPEAMAMSAILRYQAGFPNYRIVSFLKAQGVFLTWAKIWSMAVSIFEAALPVFKFLWKQSAEATLVQNDDTKMRVIDLIKANKSKAKKERKAIQTTGLIMHLLNGYKVMLFKTGYKNAGENLEEILTHRQDPDPPMQMADALAANGTGEIKTQEGGCLDHFRREYYDLYDDWTPECELILTHLREVYKVDAQAKKQKLSPAQRLALHQEKSQPHMDAIYHWMQTQQSKKRVEPNSNLGKAIQYGMNHWAKLTAFLKLEGMPISNSAVERLLKKAIVHRKNSLSYKTTKGAFVGDVLMSMIQTAEEAQANVFRYLTELKKNEKNVKEQPEQWLPWNYLQRLAQLKPAQA